MAKVRPYEAENITIDYEVTRCIHAEECVHRLQAVFDNQRRPWIDPHAASADDIAKTVEACPTGALRYTRKDGGAQETPEPEASIHIDKDGALYVRGDITLKGAEESSQHTRVALCRCGASKHKPFCDNSHKEAEFVAVETAPIQLDALDGSAEIVIEPLRDAPVMITGNLSIYAPDGEKIRTGTKVFMCRCGHSKNKPFCDGSHREVGFTSD